MIKEEAHQVIDIYNNIYQVTGELSRGGQGVVYRTMVPNVLVKEDFEGDAETNQHYMDLHLLPLPKRLHITLPKVPLGGGKTGYIMELLEDMKSFQEAFADHDESDLHDIQSEMVQGFLSSDEDETRRFGIRFGSLILNGGFRRILRGYLGAAKVLNILHSGGLVYCDFSPNNAFISSDLTKFNVWLIDADNVDFAGNIKNAFMTPDYGAPEVQSGKSHSTFWSDIFAFSSCLFQQLLHIHPFEGEQFEECLDNEEEIEDVESKRNYGVFPYILDEDDASNYNKMAAEMCDWIPDNLWGLFQQTFGQGRLKKAARPLMSEWVVGLAYALDGMVQCQSCKMDYSAADRGGICPYCDEHTPIIRVTSTFPKGNELWRFISESKEDWPIHVPLRITHGLLMDDEGDPTAFTIRIDKAKNMQIDKVSDDVSIVLPNGNKVFHYKCTDTPAVTFKLVDERRGIISNILIECED